MKNMIARMMVKANHVSHLAQEEEDTEDDEEYDGQDDGEGQPRIPQLQDIVQVVRSQIHLNPKLFKLKYHGQVSDPDHFKIRTYSLSCWIRIRI